MGNGLIRANNMLAQLGTGSDSALAVPNGEDVTPPEQVPEYIQDYVEQMDGYDSPNLEPPPLPGPLERIQIRDFTLSLTDEIEIAGQPFYYINASGDLQINGTPKDLQPSGVISLDTGWINLFSTQFRLVSNQENTATFFPSEGLNPFLDLEMRARVQETDVTRVVSNNPFTTAEISDNVGVTAFGQVEFVSIFCQCLRLRQRAAGY